MIYRIKRIIRATLKNQKGATSIEYALIMSLVFLAIVVSVNNFANAFNNRFNTASNAISAAR